MAFEMQGLKRMSRAGKPDKYAALDMSFAGLVGQLAGAFANKTVKIWDASKSVACTLMILNLAGGSELIDISK